MATIVSVRIGRTFNLGNYESERVDVEVALDPGESFDSAVQRARTLCNSARTSKVQLAAARKLAAAGLTAAELSVLGIGVTDVE